jgi:hypothetical protein
MNKFNIDQHFDGALKARGQDYVSHREEMISQGDSILPFLENKKKSKEFESELLGQIIELWLKDSETCNFIQRVAIGKEPTLYPEEYVTGLPPIPDSAEAILAKGIDWFPIVSELAWKDLEKRTNYAYSVICEVFQNWQSDESFSVLENELRNHENENFIRIKSVDTLVKMNPDKSYPIIVELFDNDDVSKEVRNSCFYNLTLVKKTEGLDKVTKVLFDKKYDVDFRCTAATAIGDLGDHNNSQMLIEALDSTDDITLKESIIDSLAILGDKSVVKKLESIVNGKDDEIIQKAASNALELLK